ncbi:MAG: hypothetical protein IPG50_13380 [Myxococcales bacterium]|nr:hypothetical protein [Myxococcales bacterium]
MKLTASGTLSALAPGALAELDDATLGEVTGGLRWEGNRDSANVEDARTPLDSPGAFARFDRDLDASNDAWPDQTPRTINTPAELNNYERNAESWARDQAEMNRYQAELRETILRDSPSTNTPFHPDVDDTILDARDAAAQRPAAAPAPLGNPMGDLSQVDPSGDVALTVATSGSDLGAVGELTLFTLEGYSDGTSVGGTFTEFTPFAPSLPGSPDFMGPVNPSGDVGGYIVIEQGDPGTLSDAAASAASEVGAPVDAHAPEAGGFDGTFDGGSFDGSGGTGFDHYS